MGKFNRALVGTHWGAYQVETCDDVVVNVKPSSIDSNPSPIGDLLYDISNPDYRISQPMVRLGYLRGDHNHRQTRGKEPFVPVTWEEAFEMAASSLIKVKNDVGNAGIYGGSYGWSSAGRFHHAQSQIHRFLNAIGGYTASVNSYSHAAAEVIIPHILGVDLVTAGEQLVKYDDISDNCDLFVAFGGIGYHNNQIAPGGVAEHLDRDAIERLVKSDTEVITISPMKSDTPNMIDAEWVTSKPCTDVAIMLGIAHYLEVNGKVNTNFIDQYTVGYDKFRAYLLGRFDGVAKDLAWSASISGLCPNDIERLASKLANAHCPLITVSASLQRAEHGEQTCWIAIVLSTMLGSLGKPGGGVGLKWGSNGVGIYNRPPFKWGKLPQGQNQVTRAIPVARVTDMLLNPGGSYTYNGKESIYPDIHLIYWAGGNPFHHQQDLNRLRRAWSKPETVIVNESVWTATARYADIVFPVNTFLERNDIVCGLDMYISPSKKAMDNYEQSRSDYEIFCELSERLDVYEVFSEGRDEMSWLETIYQDSISNAKQKGIELPSFNEFWGKGASINLEPQIMKREKTFIERFCEDPELHPLPTPSGRIEIFSSTIDSFGYPDCGGHPQWYDKREWLGGLRAKQFPLHMISPQPRNKLHSQLDFGKFSRKDKTAGRETVTLNPNDAHMRGITDGMLVRIFNDRGACLAGAHISKNIMEGVISLPTGAWYCPDGADGAGSLEYHGNPNVLTADIGTSSLAQGPTAHSCLVEIEAFQGSAPDVHELLMVEFIQRSKV